MVVAGIDIGSITTDALLFDKEKGILGYTILQTGADSRKTAEFALDKVLAEPGKNRSELSYVVATGCGRRRAASAKEAVTEITCIAKGVNHLFPEARTVIDIGGQDTKAIRIDGEGRVVEFEMNDKCAAGTGRFIEVMANALKVDLDKIGELSLNHKKDLTISSICTVFAESEVISLVSEGEELEDILYGIHRAIADRTMGLVNRLGGVEQGVVLAGGVAKNIGVVRALENAMGTSIRIPPEPQVVGALGAALLALEKIT
ncbi:MAG: R-phenyllactate dehydratase activator [Syntrophorhabdaceae bacterium PtaU1.Bin034]|jgi:predicted CoA-substrate-specific enzyme activase|nr:MAG: R-phenyllactate dehydratase activator [Syntrophorhabdaceae bacterium PtaU1.Bin034]